jgi:GNAT superfamily N-acetyltransferase
MFEIERDGYLISDDPKRLDQEAIYAYLRRSYWAEARLPHTQRLANDNSLCLGLYLGKEQAGFARVVTDYATFAYLCDVYVEDAHKSRGLGKWLMEAVHAYPRLQGLRRWSLATRDAHGLYEHFGWRALHHPERWMEKFDGAANPPAEAAS